jgi:hypothetical protein
MSRYFSWYTLLMKLLRTFCPALIVGVPVAGSLEEWEANWPVLILAVLLTLVKAGWSLWKSRELIGSPIGRMFGLEKLWFSAVCVLAGGLVCAGLTGCQTTVTRSADGTITIRTSMDAEAAAAFAERMFDEAVDAYGQWDDQRDASAAVERERWRREIEHWARVLREVQ